MYIRVSNPLFLEMGDSGRPAAGYLVYTLAAGTVDTLLTTYSNRTLTAANTNPIVLDGRGECHIFTNSDLKLVYTAPGGDLTSPIWTEDYVAEQQDTVSDKGDGVYIGNNNYTLDIVPTYTSIPDGFSLVMIPDTTCLGTLVIPVGATLPTVFTGTGINDGTFSGRYVGSTAGAVFAATIDACYVSEPAAAPTATVSAVVAATPPDAGVHLVAFTYITAEGETLIGPTDSVTADGVHEISVADILVGPVGKGITGRRLYMTEAAGSDFYLVAEIADIVTTTYEIDMTDVTLAGNAAAPVANDTGSGTGYDTFSWQIDAGAATAGVPITGVAQTLQDGVYITFANRAGHTLSDVWTVEVMTPAGLNFCGLGSDLIYKNEDGALAVLDAGDMVADYPAHLDRSLSQSCWILLNPSLPVLESIIPLRTRKEVTGNYTVDALVDQGAEINVTGTFTVTLPDAVDAAGRFFYIRNNGTGIVTVDGGTFIIKGMFNVVGATTVILGPGQVVQLVTNGVDWHVLTSLGYPMLISEQTAAADAVIEFTGLIPGLKYRLEFEVTLSVGGTVGVLFNEAAFVGTNDYVSRHYDVTGPTLTSTDTMIVLCQTALASFLRGSLEFWTKYDDDTFVITKGESFYELAGGIGPAINSGTFDGTAAGLGDLTSAAFMVVAGTCTGRLWLYQIG